VSSTEFIIGIIFNAGSALCFSIINVIIRALKDVHHSIVASFQSTGNFLLSLVVLLIYRTIISPNGFVYNFTIAELILLVFTGVCRSFSMLLFIRAFQLDKAGRTAGLNFLQIIFGYLADMIIFDY
jgi:drug/metabolite transporter (DMT)-like permease